MKNPVVYYAVMALGVIGLVLGIYWDLLKHDHPARGLASLIIGIILLVVGIAGFLVMKPRVATK